MTTPRSKAAKAEQSFDLDQARAIRRDRESVPFRFVLDGEVFALPPLRDWPLRVSERAGNGDITAALREMMDPKQFQAFLATDPTMADVEAIFNALGEFHQLGDLGE